MGRVPAPSPAIRRSLPAPTLAAQSPPLRSAAAPRSSAAPIRRTFALQASCATRPAGARPRSCCPRRPRSRARCGGARPGVVSASSPAGVGIRHAGAAMRLRREAAQIIERSTWLRSSRTLPGQGSREPRLTTRARQRQRRHAELDTESCCMKWRISSGDVPRYAVRSGGSRFRPPRGGSRGPAEARPACTSAARSRLRPR